MRPMDGPRRAPGAPDAEDGRALAAAEEARLVRLVQQGSGDGAGRLFARHWPTAWRTALAITGSRAAADDIAQDALVRAFAGIDRFDPSRPFGPWLHRIVANRALDHLRAERRLVPLEAAPEPPAPDPPAPADAELLAALARLRPERRAVVVLRHLLDYSPREIGEMLDLPEGTVSSRLARALDELRELIGDEADV